MAAKRKKKTTGTTTQPSTRKTGGRKNVFASGRVKKVNFYFAQEHLDQLDVLAKKYNLYREEPKKSGGVRIVGRNEALRRLIEESMPKKRIPKRTHAFRPSPHNAQMCLLCSARASLHPKKKS
jgi:hypothetical protein